MKLHESFECESDKPVLIESQWGRIGFIGVGDEKTSLPEFLKNLKNRIKRLKEKDRTKPVTTRLECEAEYDDYHNLLGYSIMLHGEYRESDFQFKDRLKRAKERNKNIRINNYIDFIKLKEKYDKEGPPEGAAEYLNELQEKEKVSKEIEKKEKELKKLKQKTK